MNRHTHRCAAKALLAGAFVCLSLCWTGLTLAQENSRQHDIDIRELPLAEALQAFSRQTGLQYGYLPTDEEEERTIVGPIKGRLTASEVLSKLLPEGFTFEWINVRTISIVSPPVNAPPPGDVKHAVAEKDRQRSDVSEEQKRSMAYGGGKSGSTPYEFEGRMLVEASRIFDSLDLDVPSRTIDREEIEASGASNLADLMRMVTQQPSVMPGSYLGDGTQFVDLRGLGFDTTLVLINGRRTMATASALGVNAFDVNTIPLTAVDRIEIISDSFSALHGADAIGGVFNIVLRESVPEPRLDLDYGAAAGGGVERRGAFSISGRALRASGSIVLDYFDRGPLLGRERDRWNNQDYTRFASMDWRAMSSDPGNVSSLATPSLPGLPSAFAIIPFTTADTVLTPADFVATAGQRQLESLFKYESIHFDTTRKSAMAQGSYLVAPSLSAFSEILYVDRSTTIEHAPPALNGVTVPSDNPFNPFDEPVHVDRLMTELGSRTTTRAAEMVRAVAGVRGRIQQWDWELSLLRSEDEDISTRRNELDPALVFDAINATEPELAFNPFGANPPERLRSLLAKPATSRSMAHATQALAYLRGNVFDLPTGHVQAIVGGEWRNEHIGYELEWPSAASGSHARSVSAGFGELRLPLLGPRNTSSETLTLVVSGRFDRYSDIGDSFNRQYALVWRPLPGLSFRSSYATSFRPPPLFDLHFPRVEVVVPTVDPRRNDEVAFATWRAGGNADLEASTAESITAGFGFTPQSSPNLHIAANYWRIRVDEAIGIPSAQRVLANESALARRIIRAQPTPAELAAGLPGALQVIDVTRINYGSVNAGGVDGSVSMAFSTPIGTLAPSVSATWVSEFTTSDLISGSGVSRVGVANLQGSMARWRAVAGLRWSRPSVSVTASARYIPAYADVDAFGQRNGRAVDSQLILDAQLALDLETVLGDGPLWAGLDLRIGAINLLDQEPPFAEVGLLAGYDQSQADLRQRFIYLRLSKQF
ncbi:MAG TPA: TonB-dependent receptor [Steroidobacteraceae bacterium]|nr:TonB-dependent receptor [Steroidobacteraceae bacterium]